MPSSSDPRSAFDRLHDVAYRHLAEWQHRTGENAANLPTGRPAVEQQAFAFELINEARQLSQSLNDGQDVTVEQYDRLATLAFANASFLFPLPSIGQEFGDDTELRDAFNAVEHVNEAIDAVLLGTVDAIYQHHAPERIAERDLVHWVISSGDHARAWADPAMFSYASSHPEVVTRKHFRRLQMTAPPDDAFSAGQNGAYGYLMGLRLNPRRSNQNIEELLNSISDPIRGLILDNGNEQAYWALIDNVLNFADRICVPNSATANGVLQTAKQINPHSAIEQLVRGIIAGTQAFIEDFGGANGIEVDAETTRGLRMSNMPWISSTNGNLLALVNHLRSPEFRSEPQPRGLVGHMSRAEHAVRAVARIQIKKLIHLKAQGEFEFDHLLPSGDSDNRLNSAIDKLIAAAHAMPDDQTRAARAAMDLAALLFPHPGRGYELSTTQDLHGPDELRTSFHAVDNIPDAIRAVLIGVVEGVHSVTAPEKAWDSAAIVDAIQTCSMREAWAYEGIHSYIRNHPNSIAQAQLHVQEHQQSPDDPVIALRHNTAKTLGLMRISADAAALLTRVRQMATTYNALTERPDDTILRERVLYALTSLASEVLDAGPHPRATPQDAIQGTLDGIDLFIHTWGGSPALDRSSVVDFDLREAPAPGLTEGARAAYDQLIERLNRPSDGSGPSGPHPPSEPPPGGFDPHL